MKQWILLLVMIASLQKGYTQKATPIATADYVRALKQATDIMVNDVTSPVAAARYYAYITLAANETIAAFDSQQPRFAGLIKGLDTLHAEGSLVKNGDARLAVLLALYQSAKKLLPSGILLQQQIDSLQQLSWVKKMPAAKVQATRELVQQMLAQVLQRAQADGFVRLSGLRRFTPKKGDGYWQPTAPGFMQAVEPHWYTLQPFFLDSCSQFAPPPPHAYSIDTGSAFFRELKEVYATSRNLSTEQTEIAMFWDCNPFALQQVGHLEFGLKKISPGGHWMGITGIACRKQDFSLAQTAYVHALVAMGMADAFIACWNNKYKYNRVRPVTAIKKLLDPNWVPLLQTPPFPEYTSGHSVVSAAASTILTHLFGEGFDFIDDTEEEFGLPARRFPSFAAAASEAAISRLYGGIHFRDAVENGATEGRHIGNFVILNSPKARRKQTLTAKRF